MARFFPKQTVQWKFEEPTALRKFSLSLVEMALITGVVLRLYRAIVSTTGPTSSWIWVGGTFAFGILLLCAAVTIHLANFPLVKWAYRAPLFAIVETIAESLTALVLIYFGREPSGSTRAEFSDWLPMAGDTLWRRIVIVGGWALLLAGIVWVVRRTILPPEKAEEI